MSRLKNADFRVFIGGSTCGKTTLLRSIVRNEKYKRIIWHDPNGEEFDGTICKTKNELITAVNDKNKPFRVIWRGGQGVYSIREKIEAFEFANRVAIACENVLSVWDELDVIISGKGKLPPYAFYSIDSGRHVGLRVFGIAHRPAQLPKQMLSSASHVYAFYTGEGNDIEYYKKSFGKDFAQKIGVLARYEFLEKTQDGWSVKKPIKIKK